MIGPLYGALPVAHDTGGIHDTVKHMDIKSDTGNGFLFETFNSEGLSWAIEQAMLFHKLPGWVREKHIKRIMEQSAAAFNYAGTARQYIALYERMLQRSLLTAEMHCDGAERLSTVHQIKAEDAVDGLKFASEKKRAFLGST
jgi:starch synthase/alpha-amylase